MLLFTLPPRSTFLVWLAVASSSAASCTCSSDDDPPVGGMGGAFGGGGQGGVATGAAGSTSTGTELPQAFSVAGIVVDQDGAPLEGAMVMQGGGETQVVTGADGVFEIELTLAIAGTPTAVAGKIGYRSGGEEIFDLPDRPITLTLRAVEPPDNALEYVFGHPGVGDPALDSSTAFCGHCHSTLARDFQGSAHARSARDPLLHDLYAGVAAAIDDAADCTARGGVFRDGATPGAPGASQERCYLGAGVLPDLNDCGDAAGLACDDPALSPASQPTRFGACADCHAITMDGPAGGRDLLQAAGIAYQFGNSCDGCHHVADIDLGAPPGTGGRLIMQRPRERLDDTIGSPLRQAVFGPLPDVANPFMGGSFQPKFAEAEFCAGCHEQLQGALLPGAELAERFAAGLPTHSTFSEWQDGPFADSGTPCQGCHMPPVDSLFNSVDVTKPSNAGIAGGFERAPEQTRSHAFRGPLTEVPAVPRLIDGAVAAELDAVVDGAELEVTATLKNVACGHAIPTGEPLRSLVLAVSVEGCAQSFSAVGGMTIPDFGGALAAGVAGDGVTALGSTLTWPAGATVAGAEAGLVVRVVRPNGEHWDYDGVGLFEGAQLAAADKGLPLLEPVGEAAVVSVADTVIQLDATLAVAAGDLVFLGHSAPEAFIDGAPSAALAGSPGMAFARVTVDPDGARFVPHYRAVDLASDNRIRPQAELATTHRFAIPPGCGDAAVRATVLYRPLPIGLSRERAWDPRDYLVTEETVLFTLP